MQTIKAKDPHAYDKWSVAQECSLDYNGLSPAMEKVGAGKRFKQSVPKHSLCYSL